MEGSNPFKSACEACTKAKCKCSGSQPCVQCQRRGITCVFGFKRRRGPVKRTNSDWLVSEVDPTSAKRQRGDSSDSKEGTAVFLSPYERRLWTVFFAIFKNQYQSHWSDSQQAIGWCWFARQIDLLSTHCKASKNVALCMTIDNFLDSMNLKYKKVMSKLAEKCPFSPGICAECAALVGSALSATFQVNESLVNMKGCSKHALSIVESQVTEDPPMGQDMSDLIAEIKSERTAGLILQQSDTPAQFITKTNQAFQQMFGVTGEEFNSMLAWTESGFLPWGGDVVAKLLVAESDVINYFLIMCLKFRCLGLTEDQEKRYVREVPGTHAFNMWVRGQSDGKWHKQQVLLRVYYRIMKTEVNLTTQVAMSFKILGMPTHSGPEKEPLPNLGSGLNEGAPPRKSTAGHSESLAAAPGTDTASSPSIAATDNPPLIPQLSVDTLPPQMMRYYSSWDIPESTEFGRALDGKEANEQEVPDVSWLDDLISWHEENGSAFQKQNSSQSER